MLDHVEQLVSRADSLADLQNSVLAAYGSLPIDDLRAVMASGLAVARLAGIADIVDAAASQQPAKAP